MYPFLFFFFFKQKTAYEIGLGIPAEPLFRSAENLPRFAWSTPQRQKLKFLPLRRYNLTRSEERRVGKECRSRGSAYDENKKDQERKPADGDRDAPSVGEAPDAHRCHDAADLRL